MRKTLAMARREYWFAAMAVTLVAAPVSARADECLDTGKSFAMMQEMYNGCPGWGLTEFGLRRYVDVGSRLEKVGGQRCAKLGNAEMYRTLIEMNPEIENLAKAKDLPRFGAAVCETLALRFEMMAQIAGAKPVIQRK